MRKYTLDVKNLLCPMPVIRTQNKIKELNVGDELAVLCTDPGVLEDIPAWCRINGHEIIELNSQEYLIEVKIRVC